MSYARDTYRFDPYEDVWQPEKRPWLVKQLRNVGQFVRGMSVQLRFGEISRAPLKLLRFNVLGDAVECDWLARSSDSWDAGLSQSVRARHLSLQTLRDAINVRALLFDTLPDIETADLRVYREASIGMKENIVKGHARRNDNSSRGVHSLVLRAQILGFHFDLEGDMLQGLPAGDRLDSSD